MSRSGEKNQIDTLGAKNRISRRRSFFQQALLGGALCVGSPLPFTAAVRADVSKIQDFSDSPPPSPVHMQQLECLLDLPPVTPDCARIYLCRHGQTENNRLQLVNGAREIDPALNANGRIMARRIGMALSHLPESSVLPTTAVHSLLLRSKETASLLACEAQRRIPMRLMPLESLRRVYFGPYVKGKNLTRVRAEIAKTYAMWASGDIEVRLYGGESGREVIQRVARTLLSLADIGGQNGKSIVAVSHSTYLRVLLAVVADMSLAQAPYIQQETGCINVLDVNIKGATRALVRSECNLMGEKRLSLGSRDKFAATKGKFNLLLPETHLIRINEVRHLEGVPVL